MTRGRLLIAVAVVIVAVAGFVGWRMTRSEDPIAAYCAEVEEQQDALGGELSSGGAATGLINALPAFELLAEKAPDDIAEDWKTVIDRIQTLVDAIDAAGADPATYQRDDPPPEVDRQERATIDEAAVALSAPDSQKAFTGVAQHSRDVCHTPLYLGG